MLEFRKGAGTVVAADVKNAVAAMDDALLNGVRMYASVIEATQGSNLPIAQSQRLLDSMTTGLSSMVSGRAEFVSAVRTMTMIKSRSNFAPDNFGCPDGWVDSPLAEPTGAAREAAAA